MTRLFLRAAGGRLAARLALVLVAAAVLPTAARAQSSEVYAGPDLEVAPKLANSAAAARLISEAYPEQLKRAGINGTVQIQFVVGANGKVESGSVEVVAASLPALAEAAKQVAEKIEFRPGMAKGQPVRARVALPIVFKTR